MIDLKEFRKRNKITQVELAKYLDVLQGFISQIENGSAKLPDDKLNKLLGNDKGWDTSMLNPDANIVNTAAAYGNARMHSNQTANIHIGEDRDVELAALKEKIKYLERLLDEKERLITVLMKNN